MKYLKYGFLLFLQKSDNSWNNLDYSFVFDKSTLKNLIDKIFSFDDFIRDETGELINSTDENTLNKEISKDFSIYQNTDVFTCKNIDFEDLKENLNKNVYDDKKLTTNAINHIKATHGFLVESQWETGTKNRIIEKIKGNAKYVDISKTLQQRASSGEKTLQVIHNHTSGTPLPNPKDLTNIIDYMIRNSGIDGNYGYLNIQNSFKDLNKSDITNINIKASQIYDELKNNAFKDNRYLKCAPKEVRNAIIYKYNKENINDIVKKYNNEFMEYGIEFKYTHYKLQKR